MINQDYVLAFIEKHKSKNQSFRNYIEAELNGSPFFLHWLFNIDFPENFTFNQLTPAQRMEFDLFMENLPQPDSFQLEEFELSEELAQSYN